VTIDLGAQLLGAWAVLPDEREQAALETYGSSVTTLVGARCSTSLLLKW
jgi:hypothetical protein